jgi:glycosyltransferase involved in cell wall biosynthesis
MRIAIVENLPEGGAKRVVFEQVKRLSTDHIVDYYTNELESSFDVRPFCRSYSRFPLAIVRRHGIARVLTEFSLFGNLMPQYRKMAEVINQSDVDVVLVHPDKETQSPLALLFITKPTAYFLEEWLRIAHEPDLFPVSTLPFFHAVYELGRRTIISHLDSLAVAKATTVLTSSRFNREHVTKAYHRDAEVLPLGVDSSVFKPVNHPSRDYFLFVGQKTYEDGYDLIEQVSSLSKRAINIKTVSLKQGSFRVDEAEIVRLYQHAVATLCLARNEPFGLSPLESMACGTPVIAVDEGGYRETVDQGNTGWLIDRSAKELLTRMQSLSKRDDEFEKMAVRARKKAVTTYSWDDHIRRVVLSLESILT